MRLETRQSWLAKSLALNFILLVILGNIWFVHFVTAQAAPDWMSLSFQGLVSLALILSVALAIYAVVMGARKPIRGSDNGIHSRH